MNSVHVITASELIGYNRTEYVQEILEQFYKYEKYKTIKYIQEIVYYIYLTNIYLLIFFFFIICVFTSYQSSIEHFKKNFTMSGLSLSITYSYLFKIKTFFYRITEAIVVLLLVICKINQKMKEKMHKLISIQLGN